MPGKKRTLGTPLQSGVPRISHDPLWIDDLIVWFRMDTTIPNWERPEYGDLCPPWVDPQTGQALYADYQCVDWNALDDKFIEVAYRLIPGSMMYIWPSLSDLPLPDTLTALDVTYEKATGSGSSSHPTSQQLAVADGPGSISLNPRAQAQGSCAIIPDIQPEISSVWARSLPTKNFSFSMANGQIVEYVLARVTSALNNTKTIVTIAIASPGVVSWTAHGLSNGQTVLLSTSGTLPTGLTDTRVYYVVNKATDTFQLSLTFGGSAINTSGTQSGIQKAVSAVQPMPVFHPKFYTLSGIGQHVSGSLEADSFISLSSSDGATASAASREWGNGSSQENSITVRNTRIGPVLNAALSGWTVSDTEISTVSVDASVVGLPSSFPIIAGVTNTPADLTLTATGAVFPQTIAATVPPGVPQSGVFLTDLNPSVHDDELLLVHAAIIDFSLIAI